MSAIELASPSYLLAELCGNVASIFTLDDRSVRFSTVVKNGHSVHPMKMER